MIRILFIDICRTVIAEDREKEEEIGGQGMLESKDEDDKDEYVEEEGDGEDAPFEGARMRVQVEYVDVGFGS